MRSRDLNSHPLDYEYPPLTTCPLLTPWYTLVTLLYESTLLPLLHSKKPYFIVQPMPFSNNNKAPLCQCEKLQSCHNPRDRIIYCFKLDRDADAGRFAEFERGLGLVEALPDLLASRDDYIGILLTLCNRNSSVIHTSE